MINEFLIQRDRGLFIALGGWKAVHAQEPIDELITGESLGTGIELGAVSQHFAELLGMLRGNAEHADLALAGKRLRRGPVSTKADPLRRDGPIMPSPSWDIFARPVAPPGPLVLRNVTSFSCNPCILGNRLR